MSVTSTTLHSVSPGSGPASGWRTVVLPLLAGEPPLAAPPLPPSPPQPAAGASAARSAPPRPRSAPRAVKERRGRIDREASPRGRGWRTAKLRGEPGEEGVLDAGAL